MRPDDPLKATRFRWRRFRARVFNALAAMIITLAVVVGIGRLLTPYADVLRPYIENQLSAELNAEVTLTAVEAAWPGLSPRISLKGLTIEQNGQMLMQLDLAVLEVKWLNAFRRGRVVANIALVGPTLDITQQASGDWQWAVIPAVSNGADETGPASIDTETSGLLPDWLGVSVRQATLALAPLEREPVVLNVAEADFSKQGDQFWLSGWLAASMASDEQAQFRIWMVREAGQWTQAQAWLNADGLSLPYWWSQVQSSAPVVEMPQTSVSLEAWLTWNQTQGGRLDTEFELAGPHGTVDGSVSADRLPLANGGRSWGVALHELTFRGRRVVDELAWAKTDQNQAWRADQINVALLHTALNPWLQSLERWPDQAEGQVEDVWLGSNLSGQFHAAQGQITQLGWRDATAGLSFSGLNLGLGLAGDRLGIEFSGQPRLHWPDVLRGEVISDSVHGRLLISTHQIEIQDWVFESNNARVEVLGQVIQTQDRPFLDLVIEAPRIEAVDVRPFLPYRIIPPKAMAWLDQSLEWIGQAQGVAVMHLPVGLKTREMRPGHFGAQVIFGDVDMAYARGWPTAQGLQGEVTFLGPSLSAHVSEGRVANLVLSSPRIAIDSFTDPVIELELSGDSVQAAALSNALAGLPFPGWSNVLGAMDWRGTIEAKTEVEIPLKRREDWAIQGAIDFSANGLTFDAIDLSLEGLSGEVSLTRDGIEGKGLRAQWNESVIDFQTRIQFSPEPMAEVTTQLDLGDGLTSLLAMDGLRERVSGQSDVTLTLRPDPAGAGLMASITSDWVGTTLSLPPPLSKPAERPWPMAIHWLPDDQGGQWEAMLGSDWAGVAKRWGNQWGIMLNFGDAGPLEEVTKPGLVAVGQWPQLDVGAWQSLWTGNSHASSSTTRLDQWIHEALADQWAVDLSLGELMVPGVVPGVADVSLRLLEEQWRLEVSGSSISGEIRLPRQAQREQALFVDLSHLYLTTSGVESESVTTRPPKLTNPRTSIPLTLLIESLYWGDLELGLTRVETHASEAGLELELIDIQGPDLRLQARGQWAQIEDTAPRSNMSGRLSSRNFNQLIRATGYQAGLQARQATVDFDLNWPGTPFDFNLFRLDGDIDFVLRGGNIPQASAGAGRLLGLVSFSALPRRLMLDFRDVFASGFLFDGMEGRFEMRDGEAFTDGIRLASPSAVIQITGTTDMVARTYDQSVVIEPGLGSTLPVIGGLAGGPVGAAAGLLLQSILDQPLKGVSEARYSITGPWSDPVIKLEAAEVVREVDGASEMDEPPPDGGG